MQGLKIVHMAKDTKGLSEWDIVWGGLRIVGEKEAGESAFELSFSLSAAAAARENRTCPRPASIALPEFTDTLRNWTLSQRTI